MDEDEFDFHSPIGKIIKHLNTICKKPRIDNQLNEALDLFNEHLNEQQKYLRNGIFRTNFAEAALFLQSCAELYGKKIDLLWEEMIAYLTRLIQYDCEHEKEQGNEVNQDVITQLEERRNKFKRKKKNKKVEENKGQLQTDQFLNNIVGNQVDPSIAAPLTSDVNVTPIIEDVICPQTTEAEPECREISQIPGWNEIQCLFEQVDEKQLPDKNNLLAILKVCAYGRMRFLQEKNLPLNAPYSTYKEEYLKFRKLFFEEAMKKWQNVALDTFEDLHKVLIYLAQKEFKSQVKASTSFEIDEVLHQFPPLLNETSTETIDQYLQHSDDDSLFELSFICNEGDKSDLFVHLEQLSSDIINTKLRQDSGFYEFHSDNSCDSCNTLRNLYSPTSQENVIEERMENINTQLPRLDITSENSPNDTQIISEKRNNLSLDLCLEANKENRQPIELDSGNDLHDNCDTRSIMSDHDYCSIPNNVQPLRERRGKRKNNHDDCDQLKRKHANCFGCDFSNKKLKLTKETKTFISETELMPPPAKRRKLSHKQIIRLLEGLVPTVGENHFEKFFSENYRPEVGEGEIPTRQSLSEIEQPEEQNEDIANHESESDYDSAEEDDQDMEEDNINGDLEQPDEGLQSDSDIRKSTDGRLDPNVEIPLSEDTGIQLSVEEMTPPCEDMQSPSKNLQSPARNELHTQDTVSLLQNLEQTTEDVPRHSDNDDTLSVFSEHSYCQSPGIMRNDCGVDNSGVPKERPEESIETLFTRVDDIVENNDQPLSIEDEYQRILYLLEESQKDMIDEQAGRPTEAQRKKQQALELQGRVQNWRESIAPVLAKLNEQDFDIHEYGAKIMDEIAIDKPKPFCNIVEGMSSAEVTRYFISTLQLANTNNIELCGVKPGEISNDTLEIKLLNRTRYHELLSNYQAPSKELFRERLKRLRNESYIEEQNSNPDEELRERYVQPNKRRKTGLFDERDENSTRICDSVMNYSSNAASTSQESFVRLESGFLVSDTNNNRNKSKEHPAHCNNSSKSIIENPRKGKSIRRKSTSTNHDSFEGSQAPEVLSAQIISPRLLHLSLLDHNQPSTSNGQLYVNNVFNEEGQLDIDTFERDFQKLKDVQRSYSNYQIQSTPRNDMTMTISQNTMYSPRIDPKILFD